jgi:SHS2 domain-containing protein
MRPEGADRSAGHRAVSHTADLRVEAWAATREECLAQAVLGVVEAFVDPTGASHLARRDLTVRANSDEDLLVALLEEVVYRLDTDGQVPADVELTAAPGGLSGRMHMADVASLPVVGASPKAVTWHGLAFTHDSVGWRCSVTLDV